MNHRLHPLGENAVIIELGEDMNLDTQQNVQVITSYLEEHPFDWMIEYIPAFTTITIFYNPTNISHNIKGELPYHYVCNQIHHLLSGLTTGKQIESRVVEIPVCYGGEFGPDLETVAKINGLTKEEVIHIHSTGDYTVYMIGFAPGFPYLGGMSEKISAPRIESPRLKIPERTVGIAGTQTGIYPIETPGGWQLIGRTPLKLFRPKEESPSLLKAGDKIQFKPISYEEYLEWEGKEG
jgi:inhibitor of KinA